MITIPERSFEHVAVLMGGWSAEREISLRSGEAVASALESEGYRVTRLDVQRDVAEKLAALKPDACFNALHGQFGEDGGMQGVLECLSLPYTHSGVLASALAMHKERAKAVMFATAGVPIAEAKIVTRTEAASGHVMPPPYVVKPVSEGSSVGVIIVGPQADKPPAQIATDGQPDDELMIERYVPGRELTCAVIGGMVTQVIEIVPREDLAFYDFAAKYAPGGSRHDLPAKLSPDVYESVRKYTMAAHAALGCRGVSRADFRFDDPAVNAGGTGEVVCLELNTQPGMTGTSLVPELAQYDGVSFPELVRWMVEDASCKR